MNNKVLSYLMAGALSAALALASPAFARGGGGGMGGGHGGMGGGMHGGGMGGGMRGGAMHFGGMGGAAHFSGGHFAGARFAHAGFAPRFSRAAFHNNRFFHHRHHRFAFIGAPYAYASYDSCWRRVWTPYGMRWVDVCGGYGYWRLPIGAAPAAVLIWRVAGAVADAVVVVPGPIASTPFVEQPVQRSGGRYSASSGEGSAGDDDAHLYTDPRSASRNLQVTHELVSDIYVGFAISDFADVHSAFHWPLGDGTP